jgi:hypothetical protein
MISVKHKFQSAKSDGPDSTVVQPSDWNDEHDITVGAGKVLGRASGSAGAVQELPLAFDASLQSVIPPSGTTAQRPAIPAAGMIRYNTTTSQLEIYRNSAWGGLGGSAVVSASAPINAQLGDLWYDSTTGRLLVYDGTTWSVSSVDLVAVTAVGDGTQTVFALGTTPGTKNNTTVHISGVYQAKATYSVAGSNLTFTSAPPAGASIEILVTSATSVVIPANASVTTAKLVDDAVTSGKIAPDAVTSSKILDDAVITRKIADKAVTMAKVSGSGSTSGQVIMSTGSGTSPSWTTDVGLGQGQVWQSVTGTRSVGTSYQNTNGRTMAIAIRFSTAFSGASLQVSPDNTVWVDVGSSHSGASISVFTVVPAGHYYRVTTGGVILYWSELS